MSTSVCFRMPRWHLDWTWHLSWPGWRGWEMSRGARCTGTSPARVVPSPGTRRRRRLTSAGPSPPTISTGSPTPDYWTSPSSAGRVVRALAPEGRRSCTRAQLNPSSSACRPATTHFLPSCSHEAWRARPPRPGMRCATSPVMRARYPDRRNRPPDRAERPAPRSASCWPSAATSRTRMLRELCGCATAPSRTWPEITGSSSVARTWLL